MRNCFYLFIMCLISFIIAGNKVVYHVPIQGTIDMGLPHYIQRVIDQAESEEVAAIIFDIDTFGGRVDAATQMKDIILDSKITTVAFINKRAISAGALISLSCDSIFMSAGASIGAATAVDLQGEKASEKVISYMREEMASTAEANNRFRDVASAMVDEDLSISFIVNSLGDTLTSEDVEGFSEGKLVTLSTNLAILLGIADKELNNSLTDSYGDLSCDNQCQAISGATDTFDSPGLQTPQEEIKYWLSKGRDPYLMNPNLPLPKVQGTSRLLPRK